MWVRLLLCIRESVKGNNTEQASRGKRGRSVSKQVSARLAVGNCVVFFFQFPPKIGKLGGASLIMKFRGLLPLLR